MLTAKVSKAHFVKSIEELGPDFYDAVTPAKFPQAKLRYWNEALAEQLGLNAKLPNELDKARRFQAFIPFPESLSQPLALRYHGHQFRNYNPDLGDGRGFLFAQMQHQGKLWDFGTKGSGLTPYSRSGDGRLTLKGAFREALATEWLDAVGVNTSRTFSFFETGECLERNDEPSPTRGAVLTRFSHSHIRIGTFQRLATLNQPEAMQKLLRYCVRHLFPETNSNLETPALAAQVLRNVSHRLANLAAQWMIAGFVHGVLNTDNLNITGESFDYGPYRFLPHYDPDFTAAYFDSRGLYSFGRQPSSVAWALEKFAGSLKVIAPDLPAAETLADFGDIFTESLALQFCHRLNLKPKSTEETGELIRCYFQLLEAQPTAYEQTYFDFFRTHSERWKNSPQVKSYDSQEGRVLLAELEKFEMASEQRAQHPILVRHKPVTLLIDEIEALWHHIATNDDWSPFDQKLEEIRSLRALWNLKSIVPNHFGASMSFEE